MNACPPDSANSATYTAIRTTSPIRTGAAFSAGRSRDS